jgi:hypothetical protein
MKPLFLILSSLLAGFLGGLVGTRVTRTGDGSGAVPVVRARKFELVDQTGRAISYWGIDQEKHAVLAFGWYALGIAPGSADAPVSSPGGLENPRNQYGTFGVAGSIPFVHLRAPDGETHMSLGLNPYGKPIIWMADEIGQRLFLGVMQSDTPGYGDYEWALAFDPARGEMDSAAMGTLFREKGGQRYVRGFLQVEKGEIKLRPWPPK